MKKLMRRWRYDSGYYKGYVLAHTRREAVEKASEAMDKKAERAGMEPPVAWTYNLWEVERAT